MDKLGLGVSCVSHKQDIIVIGASAGGVEALKLLVSGLPRNLQAVIFVVLHIGRGSNGNSFLPEILNGAGPLSAVQAGTAEQIQHGLNICGQA